MIAIGLSPEGPSEGRDRIEDLPGYRREIAPQSVVDLVRRSLGRFERVVAIWPAWLTGAPPLDLAGSELETGRLAVHVTYVPPLAAGVLTALAGPLSSRMGPGTLVTALPLVESQLRVFAWVRTVHRLPDPRPGLIHRLASAVSGNGFIVSSWPQPRIHRLRSRRPELAMPSLGDDCAVALAWQRADPDRLLGPLGSAIGDAPVIEARPTANGPDWWGTDELVEAVAYPTSVDALVARIQRDVRGSQIPV